MKILKCLVTAASLLTLSSAAQATEISFVDLANNSLGESIWSPLMFDAGGVHTTDENAAFLTITATNGDDSYPYLDGNHGGLGACGTPKNQSDVNKTSNNGNNRCSQGSDDNISDNGTPETVHFVFAGDVIIDTVVLNNNHDGDKSLLNDFVIAGLHDTPAVEITTGGYKMDSTLVLGLELAEGTHFDVGYYPNECGNNCEIYISSIKFSDNERPPSEIPEPATLALLSLGLIGMGAARRRKK